MRRARGDDLAPDVALEQAPEHELGERGRRGRRDAEFAAFAAAHASDLGRTAWLLTGDVHRAEELVQEALVRTYVHWHRARAGEPLAYARRVLANLRIDTWRSRRRETLTDPAQLPERVAGDGGAVVEDRAVLAEALACLTVRQRRAVVLRHFLGLPEAEVAADLRVSVGTVKSTTSRALAVLREHLGDVAAEDGSDDDA